MFFLCIFSAAAENSFAQVNPETFAEIFRRGNTEQKREALSQIRNQATAEAARAAIPALQDEQEIVRATAAFSVMFLPPDEAVQALVPLLADKKELVRREAVYALGRIRSTKAINPLIQILQKDKISEVRNASIIALGQIGDISAIAEITKLLQGVPNTKNDFLRRSAARSIGQIAQIIQTNKVSLTTPEDFLPEKYHILEKLQYPDLIETFPIFSPANNVLIQILQNLKESDDVKREAAFALGEIGDVSSIPILSSNLNAKDYYLAQISQAALNKVQTPTNTTNN